MNLSDLKNLSFKAKLSIAGGVFIIFGLVGFVLISQQRQASRSSASAPLTCNTPFADLVGDNLTASNVGSVEGNSDTTTGNAFGNVFGNGNHIAGNVGSTVGNTSCGNVVGDGNTVGDTVFGCVIGNNNVIHGNVFGGVSGTGNNITGNILNNGTCPVLTTPSPTPSPTLAPSPTLPPGNCADGVDNNQNELIDAGDPACHTDCNVNNASSYDPTLSEDNRCSLTPSVAPTSPPTASPSPTPTPTSAPTTAPTSAPTVVPGDTSFNLTLLLHGIGQGGDSANPQSGGNPNPTRPQRTVTVELYDAQNNLVVSKTGTVNFQSANGNFTGTVDMGNTITTGTYNVKVKIDQFLRTLVPGIQTITAGQVNQLPVTTMVNGDINGDNVLNILDYNLLMGCYSDFLPATNCSATNKVLTDLDDDGATNQFDYNLFLRELANRLGQ